MKMMLLRRLWLWMHACTPRLDRSFCWTTSATTFLYVATIFYSVIIYTVNQCTSTVFKHIDAIFSQYYLLTVGLSHFENVFSAPTMNFSARVLLKVTWLPIGWELVYKWLPQKMLNALITYFPRGLKFIFRQVLRTAASQKDQQLDSFGRKDPNNYSDTETKTRSTSNQSQENGRTPIIGGVQIYVLRIITAQS